MHMQTAMETTIFADSTSDALLSPPWPEEACFHVRRLVETTKSSSNTRRTALESVHVAASRYTASFDARTRSACCSTTARWHIRRLCRSMSSFVTSDVRP